MLIVKCNISVETLLQQGISEPVVYGDLLVVYKLLENRILAINLKR